MGKPKDVIWEKFEACYRQGDVRSMYCKCFACNEPVIAAVGRICDHYVGCKMRPWSIGQLDAGFQPSRKKMVSLIVSSSVPASNNQSKSVSPNDSEDDFYSGGRKHFDYLKNDEQFKLDILFARAIHRTAMPFAVIEHPTWKMFFKSVRGCFQLPSTEPIGGQLMRDEYLYVMNDVILALSKMSLICITLDGVMNVQGKQVINLMACSPIAMFLEHFTMELRKESVVNLLEKVLDCKMRLLGNTCKHASSFVLSRNIERIAYLDNDVDVVEQQGEEGLSCTKNEHFVNPPMFCFCSDSPSVMVKLRKECFKSNGFMFTYGCAPHAIHNLCMDLCKQFPRVNLVLKHIFFMMKTLKSSHFLLTLFDKLCIEKYRKTYVLIFFTKT